MNLLTKLKSIQRRFIFLGLGMLVVLAVQVKREFFPKVYTPEEKAIAARTVLLYECWEVLKLTSDDPSSWKHVLTVLGPMFPGGPIAFNVTYRAKNQFGAQVMDVTHCPLSEEDKVTLAPILNQPFSKATHDY